MKMNFSKKGFTLLELLIVMGISLTLFGFVVIGLSSTNRIFSISASREIIISDLKSQQTKAMQGIGSGDAYGIYFQPDKYVLFQGSSYSPSDPNNYEVKLDEGIVVSDISFPASTVLFDTKSGEIDSFIQGSNTITIQDVDAIQSAILNINRYGVISEVN